MQFLSSSFVTIQSFKALSKELTQWVDENDVVLLIFFSMVENNLLLQRGVSTSVDASVARGDKNGWGGWGRMLFLRLKLLRYMPSRITNIITKNS